MCLKSNNNCSIWGQLKPHLWGIVWGIVTGYDVTGSCITGNDVTGYDVTGSREPETGNEREIISRVYPVFLGTNNGNKLSCAPILLIFFSLIIRIVFVIFFLELSLIIRFVFVFVIFFLELSLIIRIVFVFVIFFLELSLIIRFVFVFVIFCLELSIYDDVS